MSVIPFVMEGENKTITADRENFDAAGNLICILGLDESQVINPRSSNASYDLRVGSEYRDHRDPGKTELSDGDHIVLQAGSAVIIETAEVLYFPKSCFGHIVPKVSLLQKGISNTSSKIDPGYVGSLLVTVFNLGKQRVTLEKGQKFCTLYVLEIKEGAVPYKKKPKRIIGEYKRGRLHKFMDRIESRQPLLGCLFGGISLLLSIIIAIAEVVQAFGH
jgi:deoxycytidine triphosphate deaminase